MSDLLYGPRHLRPHLVHPDTLEALRQVRLAWECGVPLWQDWLAEEIAARVPRAVRVSVEGGPVLWERGR